MNDVCEETGKIIYPTSAKAHKALRGIRRARYRRRPERRAYKCEYCNQYHLTSH